MLANRSVPDAAVIPVLIYPDIVAASDWLCAAFGLRERLRIGTHRAQLSYAGGAVIVAEGRPAPDGSHVMLRVEDADAHRARAAAHGAAIVSEPTDFPFGERQYAATDLIGRRWVFTQSVADVDPADFGGLLR